MDRAARRRLQRTAAAILPKSKGLFTMGVKKSTVWTRALPPGRRTTAASSLTDVEVNRRDPARGSAGNRAKICSRASGGILAAQPAARLLSTSLVIPWFLVALRRQRRVDDQQRPRRPGTALGER